METHISSTPPAVGGEDRDEDDAQASGDGIPKVAGDRAACTPDDVHTAKGGGEVEAGRNMEGFERMARQRGRAEAASACILEDRPALEQAWLIGTIQELGARHNRSEATEDDRPVDHEKMDMPQNEPSLAGVGPSHEEGGEDGQDS